MFDSEGFNGHFYSEEHDFGDEYASVSSRRKKQYHFRKDDMYYHIPLFRVEENYEIIHQTENAILFEVPKGRFWVPKKLMKGLRVHKSFNRKYV